MKYSFRNKSATTLIELILALLLLNVVILTGLSMELGLRRIFSSADLEVQVLDETAPIVTMIAKDISKGIGDIANGRHTPYTLWASGGDSHYSIRYDSNRNGMFDAADDQTDYRYTAASNTLSYTHNLSAGTYVVLSDKVVGFSISAPVNGASDIFVRLRKDTSIAASYTNPEVTVNSSAQYRAYSIS